MRYSVPSFVLIVVMIGVLLPAQAEQDGSPGHPWKVTVSSTSKRQNARLSAKTAAR